MRKGSNHTEESKQKISQNKTGTIFSEEHVQKISKALKGKKKSPEHREKLSASLKYYREKWFAEQKAKKAQEVNNGQVFL